jgi:6-phosphogluconolactonase
MELRAAHLAMFSHRLGLLLSLSLLVNSGARAQDMSTSHHSKYVLYVGTYGKGVYAFSYNADDSSLTPLSLVGEVTNPSWIVADPSGKYLFADSELEGQEKGDVVSFSIDHSTGKLTRINSRSSDGLAPCYVSVDKTGKVLVTANYTSGSVASYPLSGGKIGEMASFMTASGHGANKERQEGPHMHETVFSQNNKFLYVPDLGLDMIHIFKVDTATAKLTPNAPAFVKLAPGVGPRHIVFSPNDKFAYVVSELKPEVTVFTHDPATAKLDQIQVVPTVPADQTGFVGPAEVLIDTAGQFLYASNRGPGTIAVYSVDHASGRLAMIQTAETGFTWPRGVEFDPTGKLLFAGDQKSEKFVTFHVDAATGKLTLTGKTYHVPSPVAFLFVPAS